MNLTKITLIYEFYSETAILILTVWIVWTKVHKGMFCLSVNFQTNGLRKTQFYSDESIVCNSLLVLFGSFLDNSVYRWIAATELFFNIEWTDLNWLQANVLNTIDLTIFVNFLKNLKWRTHLLFSLLTWS